MTVRVDDILVRRVGRRLLSAQVVCITGGEYWCRHVTGDMLGYDLSKTFKWQGPIDEVVNDGNNINPFLSEYWMEALGYNG